MNCMLLTFSVPSGMRKCFIRNSGMQGQEA